MEDMMQKCGACHVELDEAEFCPSTRGTSGATCRACRRKAYRQRRPLHPRPCHGCGQTFTPNRNDKVYCTLGCRNRNRVPGTQPPRYELPPSSLAGTQASADCTRCGQPFTYIRRGRPRTTCADCRRARDGRTDGAGKYGLTPAEAARLRRETTHCGICGTTEPGRGFTGWHIDHDHESGALRGVLCGPCNIGIGHFKDDPALLFAAARYLTAAAAPKAA